MADMWRSRAPPTPLDFDAIRAGTFILARPSQNGATASAAEGKTNGVKGSSGTEKLLNGASGPSSTPATATSNGAGLKDQRALSLQDNLELFVSR